MQSNAIDKQQDKSRFLRTALRGNAIFSTISGLAAILAAGPIAALVGVSPPAIILGIGIGLIPFAWFVYQAAKKEPLNLSVVKLIIVLDLFWVLGSGLILLTGIPSLATAGMWIVGLVAEVVAVFAVLQIIGLRRLP